MNEAIPPTNAKIKIKSSGILLKLTLAPDFIGGYQF